MAFSLCVAFDVEKFRRGTVRSAAVQPRPREWDDAFRRYLEPLGHPNFMPLCGNGILNTKADYVAIYAAGQGLLNASNRIPGAFVKIIVDEACDDGNRLDGDGCSADCLSADLFQSVCEVASDELIEAMTLDAKSGDVYISTSKAIGRVEVGMRGIFTNWEAIKSFAVDAMVVDGDNIFMYSSLMTTLFKVEKLGVNVVQPVVKFDLASGERGDFIRNGNTLLLFVKDAHHIFVMDVVNSKMITSFNTTEFISPMANINVLNGRLEAILKEHFFSMGLDGSNVKFENATAAALGTVPPFWEHFTQSLIRAGSKFEFNTIDATVEVFQQMNSGLFQSVDPADYDFNLNLNTGSFILINPMVVGTKDPGLRTVLVSKASSILYGMYPDEVFATGRPEILKALLSNNLKCNGAETCLLDIPLEYDLMKQSTYNSSGRTYYDDLKNALVSVSGNLSTTEEREPLALQYMKTIYDINYPKIPKTIITIPKTLAMWFLRDGVIFHLNRRGVEVRDNSGRCIPLDVMPCPMCQWATSEHMCQPCSVTSPSAAWQVQCKDCGPVKRRLLSTALIPVTVSIGNSSDLLEIFGGVVVNNSIVTVMSTDPAATLRTMSLEISQHPGWIVLDAPRAVYSSPTTPHLTTQQSIVDEPAAFPTVIVIAAVLGVLVVLLTMWICLANNDRADSYKALSQSNMTIKVHI